MKALSDIDRYIARLIAVPLFGTLVIAAMLMVLDKMLRLFDFVAAQGGPVNVVWRMLLNMLPEYLALGIPIGLMLGILLAFRKLAMSSELDVMRGVGMTPAQLLKVPYMFTAALMVLNFAIVGFIQPLSRYAYEGLAYELRSGALGASIKVGEFTNLGKNMTLRIEESMDGGRDLHGIFLRMKDRKGTAIAVTAAQGTFLGTDDPDTIILRLTNGVLVQSSDSYASPRILTFTSHDLPVDLPKIDNFRGRGSADRELTLPELIRQSNAADTVPYMRNVFIANFHFRLVEVAMMAFLPLAALAFAIPPKRSTSSLGVFLSVVFIVTYHKINEYLEGIGSAGKVPPGLALWVPFLMFAALIMWMFHVVAYRPGGQPIGTLETAVSRIAKSVMGTVRRLRGKLGYAEQKA